MGLTVDSFAGDVVNVEAFGAVGSTNFITVVQLLLLSPRHHSHRPHDTQRQQTLHFGPGEDRKIRSLTAKTAKMLKSLRCECVHG